MDDPVRFVRRMLSYEWGILCHACRGFGRQDSKHLVLEVLVVAAGGIGVIVWPLLSLGAFDRELFKSSFPVGLLTAVTLAIILFLIRWLYEPARNAHRLHAILARSRKRHRAVARRHEVEVQALRSQLARYSEGLAARATIGSFPLRPGSTSGERFIIAFGHYERFELVVTNERGERINSLIAKLEYFPSKGGNATVYGVWAETEDKSIDLPFGDTGTLILGYSRGGSPSVIGGRVAVFSADAPVGELGTDALAVDRWSLGTTSLVRVRLTADGIDWSTDIHVGIEVDEAGRGIAAFNNTADREAVELWEPTPPPMTAVDSSVTVTPDSPWLDIRTAFEGLAVIAETTSIDISEIDGDRKASLVLAPGASAMLAERAASLASIAGEKLLSGSSPKPIDYKEGWLFAVVDRVGGGQHIGTFLVEGRKWARYTVDSFILASMGLCEELEHQATNP